jgi:hypothetical protein
LAVAPHHQKIRPLVAGGGEKLLSCADAQDRLDTQTLGSDAVPGDGSSNRAARP